MIKINTPLQEKSIRNLKAGSIVFLSGTIYTARDQAHKRLAAAIKAGKSLPVGLKEAVLYYCGPTPKAPGKIIGSSGPTTSSRMDEFTPALLAKGLKAMIGKGGRGLEVKAAIKKHQAVYFITYAGCGALLSKYVRAARIIAYPELGPEAIMELKVEDFPLFVAIDSRGRDIFKKH